MQTMQSISSDSDNSFVVDASGLVLSHTDPTQFMRNISDTSYMQQIVASADKSRYFKIRLNGQQQLVTYVKSEQLGWYFVSIKPYVMLISDISMLRNFTWLIVLAIILLGVILAYYATNKLYDPIGRLIHKVHELTGNQTSGAVKAKMNLLYFPKLFPM